MQNRHQDEQQQALTVGKKEFGDEVDVPLFSTTHRLTRTWNLKLFVQL